MRDCKTCTHSCEMPIGKSFAPVLWCWLRDLAPTQPCTSWEREPGSDDETDPQK